MAGRNRSERLVTVVSNRLSVIVVVYADKSVAATATIVLNSTSGAPAFEAAAAAAATAQSWFRVEIFKSPR